MRFGQHSQTDDSALLRRLHTLNACDFVTTAELLDVVAETDDRRLYAPAGHPSMHSYCVAELNMSEDTAFKRITAARIARRSRRSSFSLLGVT